MAPKIHWTMRERIISMLKGDKEMQALAVLYLEELYPPDEWKDILHASGVQWMITQNKICILERLGIWAQLDSGYKHSYSINTFSLDVLTEAIKQFEEK